MAILNENDKELFDAIFVELTRFPAFELEKKNRNILEKYIYKQLERWIKNQRLKEYHTTTEKKNITNEYIYDIYKKPNQWETLLFSFSLLSNRDKIIGYIAIIFFIVSFLVKANNHWIIASGIIFFLLFYAFYMVYAAQFIICNFQVNSTFSIINSIFREIKESIIDFKHYEEEDIQTKAKIIARSILKNEQSRIDNFWRKAPIFHFLFSSSLCLMFVYIAGDTFMDEIKWIASTIGFGGFKLIQELNLEQFILVFLFPIGLLLSNLAVNSGLEKRRKKITNSLEQLNESIG